MKKWSMSKLNKASVRIPEDFKFDEVFDTKTLRADKRENLKNAAYYILHLLSKYQYNKYHYEKLEKNGYHYLSAKILKKICGEKYKQVLDTLEDKGIIKVDHVYRPGNHSKGYRLTGTLSSKLVEKELDGRVRKKFIKDREDREKDNNDNLSKLSHLTKWFDPKRLTVQIKEAHNFIELARLEVFKLIRESTKLTSEQKELARARAILRFNHQINAILSLVRGDYNFSNTGNDERLHTVLTNIKKELRSFIQYDGKNLVSLDIKASQPYLLTLLLHKSFYSRTKKNPIGWKSIMNNINDNTISGITISSISTTNNVHTIMFPALSHLTEAQLIAKSKFSRFSWEDDLYKEFATHVKKELHKEITRQRAKKNIIWILFAPEDYKFINQFFKLFERLYPVEAGVIRGIHSVDRNLLPIVLQRLESRIMLHIITKKVSIAFLDAPMFTIHDSISTTPEYVECIRNIMEENLHAIVGVKPFIQIESPTATSELENIRSFSKDIFDKIVKKGKKKKGLKFIPPQVRLKPLLRRSPGYKDLQYFGPYYYAPNEDALDDLVDDKNYEPTEEELRLREEEEYRRIQEFHGDMNNTNPDD